MKKCHSQTKTAFVHPFVNEPILNVIRSACKDINVEVVTDHNVMFDYYLVGYHSSDLDKKAIKNCSTVLPYNITSKSGLSASLQKAGLKSIDTVVVNSISDIDDFPFDDIFIKPIDSTFRDDNIPFAVYQSFDKQTLKTLINCTDNFFNLYSNTFVIQKNLSTPVDDCHRQVNQKAMFVLINGTGSMLPCLYSNQTLTETLHDNVDYDNNHCFVNSIQQTHLDGLSVFDYSDEYAYSLLKQTQQLVEQFKIRNCCLWVQGIVDPINKELILTDISYRIPMYYIVTFGVSYVKSLLMYMFDIGDPRSNVEVTKNFHTLTKNIRSDIGFDQDIIDFGRNITVVNDYMCIYPTLSKRMSFKAIGLAPEDCERRMQIFEDYIQERNDK